MDGIFITNLPAVILSQDQAFFQAPQIHSQVVHTSTQPINQFTGGLQQGQQVLNFYTK